MCGPCGCGDGLPTLADLLLNRVAVEQHAQCERAQYYDSRRAGFGCLLFTGCSGKPKIPRTWRPFPSNPQPSIANNREGQGWLSSPSRGPCPQPTLPAGKSSPSCGLPSYPPGSFTPKPGPPAGQLPLPLPSQLIYCYCPCSHPQTAPAIVPPPGATCEKQAPGSVFLFICTSLQCARAVPQAPWPPCTSSLGE